MDLKKLKEGENMKKKMYRALCVCKTRLKDENALDKLNDIKNLQLTQKTPLRVLHRRPLCPRPRFIYEIQARWTTPEELKRLVSTCATQIPQLNDDHRFFVLNVKTQAGTYVKEFVHGDFGRTKPNLCDLLDADVDILSLDVTGINLEWP